MPAKPFRCKQFVLLQDGCAMKLGVDAMLLGVWADCSKAKRILDIGAGTGILALMMAQRTQANVTIHAIELEANAAQTAGLNAKNSPWGKRIAVYHAALQQFGPPDGKPYDLIVSNPPYFSNALKAPDHARRLARHTDSLPFGELLDGVGRLIEKTGKLCVILPVAEASVFIQLAEMRNLGCSAQLNVQPRPEKLPNRLLLEFQPGFDSPPQCSTLAVRYGNGQSSGYTEAYRSLTRDFYLDF